MTGFQRARSEQQREVRRRAILDAAGAMLAEMPVADVSLNELSRRAGLAKSNVLRYFDSREAVLLELLDEAWREWLDVLGAELAAVAGLAGVAGSAGSVGSAGVAGVAGVAGSTGSAGSAGSAGSVAERQERTATAVAGSLAARPVLCDLLGAQAAVLERNVSPEVAARFKRAASANIGALGGMLLTAVPELGEPAAGKLAAATVMVAGALWAHGQPAAALLAAYEADPSLAVFRLDFGETLTEILAVLVAGLLARGA